MKIAWIAVVLLIASLAVGQPAEVAVGAQFFKSEGCYGCHMVGPAGTPIGPDLSRVGNKYSREYLERWLRDPALQRPSAHMPKLELTQSQAAALAAYLASLR